LKIVEPEVRLIARPTLDWEALKGYLESAGVNAAYGSDASWYGSRYWKSGDGEGDAEVLVEVGGKVCYRSWEPGLNPNVTKVRTDQSQYLENILSSGHGSVLEHAQFSFAFRHVSRVLTHELARHRAGTAVSQESMRYVRLDDIPVWVPDWAKDAEFVMWVVQENVKQAERLQADLAEYFKLDDPATPFHEKKAKTSFMRRFAPGGVATDMIWSANIRALRHIIELRTDPSAEEEIRLVFGKVAQLMKEECPQLFDDFNLCTDGAWRPTWRKV
jgi:thymidylate synthase (FAD)